MLLEVVVVWLVVSPVLGVALGLLIARAAHMAERREMGPVAVPVAEPVAAAAAPHAALKIVTDVPAPRPVPSLDGVLHLRMTQTEQ